MKKLCFIIFVQVHGYFNHRLFEKLRFLQLNFAAMVKVDNNQATEGEIAEGLYMLEFQMNRMKKERLWVFSAEVWLMIGISTQNRVGYSPTLA